MFYICGLLIFSMGEATTINVQHLGVHPWDVLHVGMYEKFGLTLGTWTVIVGLVLIGVSLILDRRYVQLGTFLNLFLVGMFVDFFLWLDLLPTAQHNGLDILTIVFGIVLMGFGGGMYNAAGVGSGPRDGFMLSISDKTGMSIGKVRIIIETLILLIGLLLGGPIFIFTFIFTFIQSPLFQVSYLNLLKVVERVRDYQMNHRIDHTKQSL
nr:YitT family protein [Lentibacillus saliphilus]